MSVAASPPAFDPNRSANGRDFAAEFAYQFTPLTQRSIAAIRQDWADLAGHASESNLFVFPGFVEASLELLGDAAPHLLTLRQGELLIGLMILRRDWGYAKLPVPFWRTAMHHEQYLGTPLVRAGSEANFARALFGWLDNSHLTQCFLNLTMVSADGAVATELAREAKRDARAVCALNSFERAAIAPGTTAFGNPEEALRASRRKNLRKARRKLEELGALTIERLTPGGDLESWLAGFLAMENTGWKRANNSAILCCAHETALYRTIVGDAHAAGCLNFARMCVAGQPIAYTLDILAPPHGFCIKSAIDTDFRKYSPGVLMELETLRHYSTSKALRLLDSCTAPDNEMLNELWPDRKSIADLLIARKGGVYEALFRLIMMLKRSGQGAETES